MENKNIRNIIIVLVAGTIGYFGIWFLAGIKDHPVPPSNNEIASCQEYASTQAAGGKAVAVAKSPSRAYVGRPLVFDPAGSVGELVWFSNPGDQDKLMTFEDKRDRLIGIPSVPGPVTVVLVAIEDSDRSVAVSFFDLLVEGQAPTPNVPPVNPPNVPPVVPNVPPVGPKPTFEKGKYDLASFAYDEAVKVDSGNRLLATKMAQAMQDVVEAKKAAIAAGTPVTVSEAKDAIKSANRSVLDTQEKVQAWTTFLTALAAKYDSFSTAGTLLSLDDYFDAWTETAKGLAAVK